MDQRLIDLMQIPPEVVADGTDRKTFGELMQRASAAVVDASNMHGNELTQLPSDTIREMIVTERWLTAAITWLDVVEGEATDLSAVTSTIEYLTGELERRGMTP